MSLTSQHLALPELPPGQSSARESPPASRGEPHFSETLTALLTWTREFGRGALARHAVPGATLEERRRLATLGGLVGALLSESDRSGLPTDVLAWVKSAPTPPASLVQRVATILDGGAGPTFLARAYESLIDPANRRALGTFFTPHSTVEWMLREWDTGEPPPRAVVDVGAGVGAFTTAAQTRWPSASIFAVDINPVTLGLLGLLCSASVSAGSTSLVRRDYLEWRDNNLPSPCVTLGNPPYTRLQLLGKAQRKRLVKRVAHCGSRAGLSTWILADAFTRLRREDGLLFLLPTNWLEAEYSVQLRAELWRAIHRRVELTVVHEQLFGDARVDAVVLLVGSERQRPQPFTIRRDPSGNAETHDIRTGMPPSLSAVLPRSGSRSVRRTVLSETPLSSLAAVRRGAATGANFFFLLSDKAVAEWELPANFLHAVVRRLRDFPGDELTSKAIQALGPAALRWLLIAPEVIQLPKSVRRYIDHGKALELDQRHLCQQRSSWYSLGSEVRVPDIIVGAMSSSSFRFLENTARAAITNNLFGLSWHDSIGAERRARVLTWLRSDAGQRALRGIARVQAGGLRKLEPGVLSRLHVPAD